MTCAGIRILNKGTVTNGWSTKPKSHEVRQGRLNLAQDEIPGSGTKPDQSPFGTAENTPGRNAERHTRCSSIGTLRPMATCARHHTESADLRVQGSEYGARTDGHVAPARDLHHSG